MAAQFLLDSFSGKDCFSTIVLDSKTAKKGHEYHFFVSRQSTLTRNVTPAPYLGYYKFCSKRFKDSLGQSNQLLADEADHYALCGLCFHFQKFSGNIKNLQNNLTSNHSDILDAAKLYPPRQNQQQSLFQV